MSEPIRRVARTAVVLGFMVAVAACQSPPTPQGPPSAANSSSATASTSPTGSAAAQTVIDIAIADGAVTPTNATVEGSVGQPIILVVSSDVVDSLHVHSVPEHVFDVEARPDQRFEFIVKVPGRVDVELHDLHRTVVTIGVTP